MPSLGYANAQGEKFALYKNRIDEHMFWPTHVALRNYKSLPPVPKKIDQQPTSPQLAKLSSDIFTVLPSLLAKSACIEM